jgi:hypothetical protein
VAEISFASLSPTLLARKGGAKPAMRPQHAALASMPNTGADERPEPEALEDLGWNDMGEGEHATAEVFQLTPMARASEAEVPAPVEASSHRPAVLNQQHAIAERLAAPQPTKRRPARERVARAAFTLRLDADRHLKLRLATTIRGVSAQALVTDALDALLAAMPELDTLAAQVKRR